MIRFALCICVNQCTLLWIFYHKLFNRQPYRINWACHNDNPVFCPNRLWWGWSWMISTLMHCDPGTSWGYFRLAMIHDVNNYLHNYIYMYIFIRCNYSSIPRWFRHNSCNFTKRQLKLYSVITITSHRNIWMKSLTCGLNSENSGNKDPLPWRCPTIPCTLLTI